MQIVFIIVWSLLNATELLLLFRAILSWLPVSGRITDILERVTEPIIMPMRVLFDRLGIELGIPIDLPYLATFILLSVLSSILTI